MKFLSHAFPTNRQNVVMGLVVNVGSLAEREEERGIAHFVEHMAFAGTTHFPKRELLHFLDQTGLVFGADTRIGILCRLGLALQLQRALHTLEQGGKAGLFYGIHEANLQAVVAKVATPRTSEGLEIIQELASSAAERLRPTMRCR